MHRNSNINDLNFIYDLIMDGSKHGYFNREYQTLAGASNGLKLELKSILSQRKRHNGLTAYAVIFECNNKPAGFVIMSAGPDNKGNELWMASILPSLRGKGLGNKMIKGITERFVGQNVMLMARCAPESEIMYNLLLNNGFQYVATGEEGYRGVMFVL